MTRRLVRAITVVSMVGAVLIGGMGPASADEDHINETFTESFGPEPIEVGANPCTGEDFQTGSTTGMVVGQIEIEAGREHHDVTIERTDTLDNGWIGEVVERQEADIEHGEGEVYIELEVETMHPETGDNFGVEVDVVLTISGGGVAGADVEETISECHRGG